MMRLTDGLKDTNRVLLTRQQATVIIACGFCATWGGCSDGIPFTCDGLRRAKAVC
ncbi:hypothetical protein HUZ79_19430 [Klebsiella quasipneumoniae]|nr:hypothetical protein HUZ79_19430 [Klebsiella quasipneumoniae]